MIPAIEMAFYIRGDVMVTTSNRNSNDEVWNRRSANVLRAEMLRAGLDNEGLAALLETVGVDIVQKTLANKINRGTFQFGFFLQCMKAMGVKEINLYLADSQNNRGG
jgi:hypothetical protein